MYINLFWDQLESPVLDTTLLKPTGRVVGIIKRNWRPFCGMLNQSQIKEVKKRVHYFSFKCSACFDQ